MSNHWSSLSLPCTPPRPQNSQTFFLKPESLSLTPSWVQTGSGNLPRVRTVFYSTGTGWAAVSVYQHAATELDAPLPVRYHVSDYWDLCWSLSWCTWMYVCVCWVYDPGNTVTVLSCRHRAMEVYTDRHTERLSLSLDLNWHPRSKSWLENPIFFFISIHNIFYF